MSQKNCYYKVTDLNESQIDFCRRKTEENCSVMNDGRTLSPPAKQTLNNIEEVAKPYLYRHLP